MDVVRDGNESHTKVRDAGNDEQRAACGRDLSSSSTRTRQFWTLHRGRSALRRALIVFALFAGAARTFAISTPAQGAIAAGGHHVLALKADGTVWSWGANDTGQLGTNDGPARAAPAPIAGLSSVAAIATGYGHSLALKVDGTVWAWGDNSFAQLGDGTQINRSVPVPIVGLTNIVAIAAGRLHSLALQSDGTLWAWGADFFRQLGDGGFMTQLRPIRITMPGQVARVFASDYASAAVLADGSAWRWGYGSGPAFPSMSVPTRVADLPSAAELALGFGHLVARTANGDVWVVGANDYGQLGVGNSDASAAPRSNGLAGVTMLAVNDSTNFALLADGSLRAWGRNIFGGLGDGTKTNRLAPISTGGAGHYVAVAAGEYFGVALDDAGGVWQWGRNDVGQAGDGGSQQLAQLVQVPKLDHLLGVSLTAKSGGVLKSDGAVWTLSGDAVPDLSGIVAVAIGSAHSAALKSDGTVWMWGANESGQLGNGSSTFSATPVAVSGAAGAVAVDVGLDHTVMLKNDGSVWSWGGNNSYQLGDGTKVSRSVPVSSTVASEAVGIGSGYGYSVAIKPDGTVARWGLNGTVVLPGLSGIVGVSAGNNHALAVKNDGTVWGWGDNTYGQLGLGNAGGYYTSGVQVPGLNGIVEVAAGATHSLARRNDGQVFAWGQNRKGALGDGSSTSRFSPVAMTPNIAARSIAAGDEVTALVKTDGTLWAAGDGVVFNWDTFASRRAAIRLVAHADDLDGDGMSDVWELSHFGNLSRNGAGDADGDGLTDIREALVGTDPLMADTDGDGKMDSADTQPLDYFDGVTPTLAVVAGDNQVAAPGEFTPLSLDVGVWNHAGTEPLVNAPVTFAVTTGGGKLATAIGGTLSDTLTLRSDNDGSAQAFYKHPSTPATNSTITVTAGSAEVQFHASTTSPASGPPTITLTAPAEGSRLDGSRGVVLLADAFHPSGAVTRVEFFADEVRLGEATTEPFYFVWSQPSPGAHTLVAKALDVAGVTAASIPVTISIAPAAPTPTSIDFETSDGYFVGALVGHASWDAPNREAVQITASSARTGQQSLLINPPGNGAASAGLLLPPVAPGQVERFIDFWWKPVADTTPSGSALLSFDGPIVAFVRNGDTAELQGYLYSEGAETFWNSDLRVPVAADGTLQDWQHVVIREDLVRNRCDVYLNGQLALADIVVYSFDSAMAFFGHRTTPTSVDTIRILADNPIFPDADHDGLDDRWEAAHGLNPASDDRLLDNDGDGISNLDELRFGSPPVDLGSVDRDANGFLDQWEREHFGRTGTNPDADPDGDGISNRGEFARGTKPTAADTDGDGLDDGEEAALGTDPTDPASNAPAQLTWLSRTTSQSLGHTTTTELPGLRGFEGTVYFGRMDWRSTLSGDVPPYLPRVTNLSVIYLGNAVRKWKTINDGVRFGGSIDYIPAGTSEYVYPPVFWYDINIIWGMRKILTWNAGNYGGSVSQDKVSFARPLFDSTWTQNWQFTETIEVTLSEPTDPIVTTVPPGLPSQAPWAASANPPVAVLSEAYSISVKYAAAVSADTTGIIRWFEVFTPADGGPKQYLALREFDATAKKRSGDYTLSCPAVGTTTVEMFTAQATLAVDANRDGTITFPNEDTSDSASKSAPYRFWLNDDIDRSHTVDGNDIEEDDLFESPNGKLDWDDGQINSKRDLEDFARLKIYLGGLQDAVTQGTIKVGLKWKPEPESTGAPSLKVWRNLSPNGGTEYLTDEVVAQQQLNLSSPGLVQGTTPYLIPTQYWTDVGLSAAQPYGNLLFEGCTAGKGHLVITLHNSDGTENGEGPGVWIELKSIEEFYERWTAGDGNGGDPATAATRKKFLGSGNSVSYGTGFEYAADAPEEQKYILYVHGWNMQPEEKNRFAETAFKRLYWQGYKGRFGVFCWPTTYNFGALVKDDSTVKTWLNSGYSASTDPTNYDRGEWTAWKSSFPLMQLLTSLRSSYPNVNVIAHSMGNIVTGEALRRLAHVGATNVVDCYVASQAALPAHSYDGTVASDLFADVPLATLVAYTDGGHPETPNIYPDWLAENGGAAGRRVNFYNVNDFALWHDAWEANQFLKPDGPDDPDQPWTYKYLGEVNVMQDLFKRRTPVWSEDLHLGDATIPENRWEIQAFAAEARSRAVGAKDSTLGMNEKVDLQTIWADDTGLRGSSNQKWGAHKWHSAQFRSTNMRQANYWKTLLGPLGFNLPTTP